MYVVQGILSIITLPFSTSYSDTGLTDSLT